MKFDFEVTGDIITVDTKKLDYEFIWDVLRLSKREREGSKRIIDLYNSTDFNDLILIITPYSWMKPHNREAQQHRADHYRTRLELERAAQDNGLVRKLIHSEIVELHPKWEKFLFTKRHPQAPYRLNAWRLYLLEKSSPEHEDSDFFG